MSNRIDMKKYFKKIDGEEMVSGAALLWMTSEAINSPETGTEGQERARRVVEEVISAGCAVRFEKADILETMLVSGAPALRLLPLCDELVQRIGADAFWDALLRAGFFPDAGEDME
ncbi:hypothetical protein EGT07_18180 [Herbaspirillum sp. HC18]|nr:hypothetical protein EGT07_18180 [Herbaspirillum sp. HC18]